MIFGFRFQFVWIGIISSVAGYFMGWLSAFSFGFDSRDRISIACETTIPNIGIPISFINSQKNVKR